MNTSKYLVSCAVVVIALAGASCTNPIGPAPSAQVRALSANEQKVAEANGLFALRFFQQSSRIEGEKNMFISPLSYKQALTMAANGAANATRDSMLKALQISGTPIADINDGSRTLNEYLLGLDRNVEFRIANGIWYNQQFTVEQPFLTAVRQAFGAEVRGMAFGSADVKGDINRWVEQQTNNRIKDLITKDFSANDLMCLVNAVYFNAVWKSQFAAADTKDEPFKRENGTTLTCKMMNLTKPTDVRTSSIGKARLVELPYSNGQFTMTILLPNDGERLNSVIASLTPATFTQALQNLSSTATLIALPKFTMETRYEERQTQPRELHALGMGLAFTPAADFSAMYRPPLRAAISFVIHKTFLQVDERGTEAAAATAVGIELTSAPAQPRIIRFDRPFAFFIREKSSNMILFAGTLYEPKI
ncbi:MAG: serpin family protein [Candidatus Kapabacteria bacterium]|jgi:serpin B|nr:serpin family protein [Candidatus Kapabacteria bacterium]